MFVELFHAEFHRLTNHASNNLGLGSWINPPSRNHC